MYVLRTDSVLMKPVLDSIASRVGNSGLLWFGHVDRVDENSWASRCRTIKVTEVIVRERTYVLCRKNLEEMIRIDLVKMSQ